MDTLNGFFDSFLNGVAGYLPNIIGALLLLIIGFMVAKFIRKLVRNGLRSLNLNKSLEEKAGIQMDLGSMISKIVYYILLVIVLLITLNILNVEGVLDPLKNMVNEFLAFIPNLVAAVIIGLVGYILAKVISEIAEALVQSAEALSDKMGLSENISLAKIVKQVVFILVFLPVFIVALDALEMKAISEPATDMLNTFLSAIPSILAAAIILIVFFLIAKFVTPIVTNILKQIGTDELPEKMGLSKAIGQTSLSKVAGNLLFFFIMFFGLISALNKVGLNSITTLLSDLLELSGQIVFGLIIIAVGNFIAGIAHNSLINSEEGGKTVATIARFTILGLFIAIALRTMGIANDIINLAFALTLGAAAVAFALSFGLGGREAAGKQMEHFFSKYRDKNSDGSANDNDWNNPTHPDQP